jgi:phage terminase large subunit-like protein
VRADLQRLLDDPALFIVTYFPHRIKALKPFHVDLIDAVIGQRRSLILYPATHGKTTIVSTLLTIHALCKDPNIRIAIIGKNDTETEGIMQVIQAELTDNEELIRDFGPFRPNPDDNKPWALGRMSVAKRTRRAKEPTITVFGSGAKTVLGYRTDWTICDDVITEKNSSTPEQRQKIKDWFNLCVATGPENYDSRLTVVGTRFDPDDLYADLEQLSDPENGSPIWQTKLVDAIVDEENHVTLWPERWPWKRLMIEKAQNGTLSFNKRYRNIAVDESRLVFKEEYVKGGFRGKDQYPGCLDRTYKVGEFGDNWRRAAGFDPAVGSSKSAKFCAHVVLGEGSCKDHERCYWIIDLERQQMTLPQMVEMVLSKHGAYGLQTSKVEANSFQAGLNQEIERRMNEAGLAWRIEPHYTNRTNKPDPELGVQAMSPWVEQGKFHIPWADQFSRRKMQQLVDEMIQYPGRTTDTVMALWFAWRALESTGAKFPSFSRLPRESPFLHRQLRRRVIRNPAYEQTERQVA